MGRSSILIELNPEYVKLIRERCETSHVALETFEEAVIDESP
jgi:DNA modification methylase